MSKVKVFILLHAMLMLYSVSGICSKLAAGCPVFSIRFCLYYAAAAGLLGIYAAGWQQVIKRLPLTAAFANKSVTVIWGLVWGACFFQEPVTAGRAAGILLIMAGVIIYAGESGGMQDGSGDD